MLETGYKTLKCYSNHSRHPQNRVYNLENLTCCFHSRFPKMIGHVFDSMIRVTDHSFETLRGMERGQSVGVLLADHHFGKDLNFNVG